MQSGSLSFYLVPPEQLLALQIIGKMSKSPFFDELIAKISKLMSEVSTLQHQV